jgi:hypothetical protein
MRILISVLLPLLLLTACANQAPRLYEFDDVEVFSAPYDEVWAIVDSMSKGRKWRLEESSLGADHSYLTTKWMPDLRKGGDYGSVGIALGKGNKPLNDKTREVAISIRVVSETKSTIRVKVTCLFRIQTSSGYTGASQTMFGTSKGIVEGEILNAIRSRLVLADS